MYPNIIVESYGKKTKIWRMTSLVGLLCRSIIITWLEFLQFCNPNRNPKLNPNPNPKLNPNPHTLL